MNKAEIRVMTINDYSEVHALWSKTSGVGLNEMDDSKSGIAKYLARNPLTCFVAEMSGEIVGAVLGGHDGRRGTICHLAVAHDQRGQGIGTALVDATIATLKHEGIRKIWLVVMNDNMQGNDFWEKQGFTLRDDIGYRDKAIIGERKVYIC
ncbi:MAG: GNAT family N-acetyltransferase [Defluviitaleaceae bacterium]|nr:GNAT family N-acetyltransferase [Defluviitaleaceae bacterium]